MNSKKLIMLNSTLSERWKDIPLVRKHVVWAEVSSKSLLNNIKRVKNIIGTKVSIMAIVKSNAYGHGAVEISKIIDHYVNYLGVSRLSEAVDLRINSINKPILMLGYTHIETLELAIDCSITQAIHSYEMAKEYSDKAVFLGKKLKVHIKLDTGMGRLGLFLYKTDSNSYKNYLSETLFETEKIAALPGLELEGVFTHLSSVEISDIGYAYKQLEIFNDYLNQLDKKGITFRYRHAAGTFAMLNVKNSLFDMVRIGKALYGVLPEGLQEKFKQALTVKTLVSFIKTMPEDVRISYAGATIVKRCTKIATVPFGFADGYIWQSVPDAYVLIHGQKAPVVGRICMDFMMIDVTHIDGVRVGDEIVITGVQGCEKILLTDLAKKFFSTPSSLAVSLTAKAPKIIID